MNRLDFNLFPEQPLEAIVVAQRWVFREELWPRRTGMMVSAHRDAADYESYTRRMKDPDARQINRIAGGIMNLTTRPPELAIVTGEALSRIIRSNYDGILFDPEHDRAAMQQITPITTFN